MTPAARAVSPRRSGRSTLRRGACAWVALLTAGCVASPSPREEALVARARAAELVCEARELLGRRPPPTVVLAEVMPLLLAAILS